MQSHKEKISTHRVYNTLDDFLAQLREALGESSYSQEVIEELNRELLIYETIRHKLNSEDKQWFSVNFLDKISGTINDLQRELNNFKSSKNEDYINNMMLYTDGVLDLFRGTVISEREQCDITRKYISDMQYAVGKLNTQVHTTQANSIELEELVEKQKKEIESLKNDIIQKENDFKANNERRLTQLDESINNFKNRMEEVGDRLKERNESTLTETMNSIKVQLDTKIQEFNKLYKEQEEKLSKLREAKDEELTLYIDTAKTIVGQVNTTMFSYKYKQVADNAKNRGYVWNAICFISLVAAAITAYYTMTYMTEKMNVDLFWYGAIARSIIIIIALTASGYAGKQANAQGKIERYARKIEMELVAFDTFVENMPEDVKKELKSEVVKRIFINREDIIDENIDNSKDKSEILQLILDKISALVKKE